MKLSRIKHLLDAESLCLPDEEREVGKIMGSDMMSDVLAYAESNCLLVTGLISSQSVRTADVADAAAIVYVRGKRPDEHTIKLGEELNIPMLATELGMFEVCGILHAGGLKGVC